MPSGDDVVEAPGGFLEATQAVESRVALTDVDGFAQRLSGEEVEFIECRSSRT